MVVDGQCSDYRMQSLMFLRAVFLVLCCLSNILVTCGILAYADDATLFASVPSPHMKPFIAVSLNRDLDKISAWCKL